MEKHLELRELLAVISSELASGCDINTVAEQCNGLQVYCNEHVGKVYPTGDSLLPPRVVLELSPPWHASVAGASYAVPRIVVFGKADSAWTGVIAGKACPLQFELNENGPFSSIRAVAQGDGSYRLQLNALNGMRTGSHGDRDIATKSKTDVTSEELVHRVPQDLGFPEFYPDLVVARRQLSEYYAVDCTLVKGHSVNDGAILQFWRTLATDVQQNGNGRENHVRCKFNSDIGELLCEAEYGERLVSVSAALTCDPSEWYCWCAEQNSVSASQDAVRELWRRVLHALDDVRANDVVVDLVSAGIRSVLCELCDGRSVLRYVL